MSKKVLKFRAPRVINVDEIGYMTDDDLNNTYDQVVADRNKVIAAGSDPRKWDVELAYLIREMKYRDVTRKAHNRYNEAEYRAFRSEEELLPTGNFDNIEYVNLCSRNFNLWMIALHHICLL